MHRSVAGTQPDAVTQPQNQPQLEALLAFRRAGADSMLSYFALDAARLLRKP